MTTSTHESAATSPGEVSRSPHQVLKRAALVWRRAGVRPADRAELLSELDAELGAARDHGAADSSVLGHDPNATLRAWAEGRGLAGRSLRAGVLIPVALFGVLLGSATLIAQLIADFAPMATSMSTSSIPGGLALTIWGSSALMSVLVPVLGCWAVLQAGRDPLAGASARWLLLTMPVGEGAAVGLGVAAAAAMNFSYDAFPVVVLVVLATMAGAVLAGRAVAIRRARALVASATSSAAAGDAFVQSDLTW